MAKKNSERSPITWLPVGAVTPLFAAVYFGFAEFGGWLSNTTNPFVSFWFANGLFLAVLIRSNLRNWPSLTFAATIANLIFDLLLGKPLAISLGFVIANATAVLTSAWLIRRFIGRSFTLARINHLFTLLAIIAFCGMPLGALIGATTLSLFSGLPFAASLRTWWIGDLVGMILVIPFALALLRDEHSSPLGKPSRLRALESLAVVLVTSTCTLHIFTTSFPNLPMAVVLVPPLMWAAVRIGWRGVAVSIFFMALLAVLLTKFGHGPFSRPQFEPAMQAIRLQSLISITSLTFLSLAALMHERRRGELELLASRAEWEKSFDALPDFICVLDLEGRILRSNRAMQEAFEPRYGRLVGLDHKIVFCGNEEPSIPLPCAAVLHGGPPQETEATLPTLPGHFIILCYPLKDVADHQWGAVCVVRDITARKKLEGQLRQSQKMDALGQLTAGIAHDFNNLLTIINGYSEILLAGAPPDEALRHNLEQIRSAGDQAASLTRQLLTFSRQTVLEMKVLDLNAVLIDTESMLRRLVGDRILLTLRRAPDLAPIKSDAGQLHQVILNLAFNARDAMPEGGRLTIETATVELDEPYCNRLPKLKPGTYVRLTVSDTGCGMTPDVQARIFEPFFTTKGVGKGTGLGLPVVHGIVEQSGGHIRIASEPGNGTTFELHFPIVEQPRTVKPDPKNRVPSQRGTETLLLVEDENVVRAILEQTLTQQGYTVLAAQHGEEALRMADEHRGRIDLLVTDIIMPGMNGRQLADALRDQNHHFKILYMSGYASDALLRRDVQHGDADFIEKPFTPAILAEKVRAVLDATRRPITSNANGNAVS